jgi:VacB/RNase II family 3'-5' exoribonuclease
MSRGGTHRHDLRAIARRAMLERGLLPDFEPAVTAEVTAIGRAPTEASAGIKDLRALLWASIDNDDSRDLDQLTVGEPAGDATKILVAIADVDGLVKKGSAVDDHARHNTTSVYTAAEVFPMLPTVLSTDLTSLGENEDRLAIVIEMVVDGEGAVGNSAVYRALVRNHAKLAYDAVAAWLDGGAVPERVTAVSGLDANLRVQDAAAQRLKRVRHEHGALELETIEPRAVFTDDVLTDLRREEPNRAKELIEELMVAANGVTAKFLLAKRFPSMRRVLRSPERWQRIVDLASQFHEDLPATPDAAALDRFLAKRRAADPNGFPDLSLAIVKLLGSGEYQVEIPGATVPGHFGLAVQDYTHSTAPNRRYPDVITQRLLKAAIGDRPQPYTNDELDTLARHCTEQEDNAKKVERQVRKSASALLLEPRIGAEFDGIVTGASEKGTWVRIFHPPAEGKVVEGVDGLDVGDRVRVKLVATNVERGFIDFARVGGVTRFHERRP